MEILANKALLIRTQRPEKYSVIPRSRIVEQLPNGGCTVAVYWGLDEARVLRNLGVRNVPSPILRDYDWPNRFPNGVMAHQRETAAFLSMHNRAFCFNEPGTSKTASALWAADYLMKKGKVRRVLVVCPVSIMTSAWIGDISNTTIHRSAIVAHHKKASRRIEMLQGDYEIVILNYDGLNIVAKEVKNDGRFDLVIVDECFVAGTPVRTAAGDVPIETLRAGDSVLTSTGVKRIKKLVRKTAQRLVRLHLSDDRTITCTPEHPFFTDAGWVTAEHLRGRRLVSAPELSHVQHGVPDAQDTVRLAPLAQYEHGADLLQILRTEEVPCAESRNELLPAYAGAGARAADRDDAHAGTARAHLSCIESDGASSADTQRQRHWHDAVRETGVCGAACGLGMELPGSVGQEAARLSYELQARLRASAAQGGAGSGRQQSLDAGTAGTGPQERATTEGTRVVGVAHIECAGEVPVFNLEVEGIPNYFVGGHLVHNCNAYKNPYTDRWKALASIITPDTYLWMMTGTPAAQSPVDAYGLARLINPSGVPHLLTGWRDKVMNKISTFKWVSKPNAKELVHAVLQPAIRFAKSECVDLPPVITETREVEMTAQQRKYYQQLKSQMMVMAAGETISAVNAGVALNKLLQISCGAAYTDDKETVEFDAGPRLKVLSEIIEETDRKLLIFAMFRSSIDTITRYLDKSGIKSAQIHGEVSANKRTQIINDFQTQTDPHVLVMQPQATAHGITLTAADTVIFFGPLMSVELYLQCIARADRKGQTADKVRVIHIQSSPVEERLFKAMHGKVNDHTLLIDMFNDEVGRK